METNVVFYMHLLFICLICLGGLEFKILMNYQFIYTYIYICIVDYTISKLTNLGHNLGSHVLQFFWLLFKGSISKI